MMKSQELKSKPKALNLARSFYPHYEKIIYSLYVKSTERLSIKKRLFVITETGIGVSQSTFGETELQHYFWTNIQSVILDSKTNTISINPVPKKGRAITIQHEDVILLCQVIIQQYANIFENTKFSIFKFPDIDLSKYHCHGYMAYNRLRYFFVKRKLANTNAYMSSVMQSLISDPTRFDLSILPANAQPYFFQIFYLLPFTKTLLYDFIPSQSETFQSFIENNNTIEELVISNLSEIIQPFCKALSKRKPNLQSLNSLVFQEPINMKNGPFLNELQNVYPFHKFSFLNDFSFPNLFKNSLLTSTLKEISFSKISMNTIISLSNNLSSIRTLRITDSDLDISEFLVYFNQLLPNRVETLDLSGNTVKTFQLTNLPPDLHTLIFNSCSYVDDNFTSFFSMLVNASNHSPFSLSFSSSKLTPVQFNQFFNNIANIKGDLTELHWDNNQVHGSLFSFLKKCQSLTSLSLSQCNSSDVEIISNFITSAKSLEQFWVRGGNNKGLNNNAMSVLLNAISKNNKLRYIDLSNNYFNEENWALLGKTLIQNPTIEELQLDFTLSPRCFSCFHEMTKTLYLRGKPIVITMSDLQNMIYQCRNSPIDVPLLQNILEKLTSEITYRNAPKTIENIVVDANQNSEPPKPLAEELIQLQDNEEYIQKNVTKITENLSNSSHIDLKNKSEEDNEMIFIPGMKDILRDLSIEMNKNSSIMIKNPQPIARATVIDYYSLQNLLIRFEQMSNESIN